MSLIPEPTNTVRSLVENKTYQAKHKNMLDLSAAGKSCARQQWFSWRWASTTNTTNKTAKLKRVYESSVLNMSRVKRDLQDVGVVFLKDVVEVTALTGHISGYADGVVTNVPGAEKTTHLVSVKLFRNATFNALTKKTTLLTFPVALKELHHDYWSKLQLFMGYLGLTRCLYVGTNKDTEERLYERVQFVEEDFKFYQDRMLSILTVTGLPARVSERENWYQCKLCDFKDVCFGHSLPEKNCRTCEFAVLHSGGKWLCSVNENKDLTLAEQEAGCDKHVFIPCLSK